MNFHNAQYSVAHAYAPDAFAGYPNSTRYASTASRWFPCNSIPSSVADPPVASFFFNSPAIFFASLATGSSPRTIVTHAPRRFSRCTRAR